MNEIDFELFEQVKKVIDRDIKPFIEADGGIIHLVKVSQGIVYVQLKGACAGCPGSVITLRSGVERILKTKINGIKAVKLA